MLQAQESALIQNRFTSVLEENERKLLNDMVNKYNQGKITYEYLLGKVAAISEMRSLKAKLNQNTLLAIQDDEEAYGN